MATGFSSGIFELISSGLYRVNLAKGFSTGRSATGLEKLAFEVIYFLMTTKGSIPGDSEVGTRLRGFIGTLNVGRNPDGIVASMITDEVSRAAEIIKARQASAMLTPAEALDEIYVDQVLVDRDTQSAAVRFMIKNKAKQTVGFEINVR